MGSVSSAEVPEVPSTRGGKATVAAAIITAAGILGPYLSGRLGNLEDRVATMDRRTLRNEILLDQIAVRLGVNPPIYPKEIPPQ